MSLDDLKSQVRTISATYRDREERSRRLFIQEKAQSLRENGHVEFKIKSEISKYYRIPFTAVSFCGSAQLGFSIHKDRLFEPSVSDLDVACINADLFQRAWIDVVSTTNAFNDLSKFGHRGSESINLFKDQILRRGMINIEAMPQSHTKTLWTQFQSQLSRKHRDLFGKITIAIYMNEYAFCWKQDSAISGLAG